MERAIWFRRTGTRDPTIFSDIRVEYSYAYKVVDEEVLDEHLMISEGPSWSHARGLVAKRKIWIDLPTDTP